MPELRWKGISNGGLQCSVEAFDSQMSPGIFDGCLAVTELTKLSRKLPKLETYSLNW